MLTDKAKFPLNFFCHKVPAVIAQRARTVANNPNGGISFPKSIPNTVTEPTKPKKIPTHCYHEIFSPKIGPDKIFVKIGCNVTISATIAAGIPIENAYQHPPK